MNINPMSKSVSQDQEAIDRRFLAAALRLARKHEGLTGTNPSVACVIVADTMHGKAIVGSAVTAKGGRPHAEPPALEEAGDLARGATAYVTLEPCAHHGKTPPCAQTLIDAGVARVVTAIADPDDRVNGKGHQMLIAAGVEVTPLDGGEAAERVIQGYLKARNTSIPFVTLKLAMSEGGLIGSTQCGNLKISGKASGLQTHLVRARHHAIMIGSGTALADDPWLNCRLPGLEERSPIRVVLDAKARLSADSHLVGQATKLQTIVAGDANSPQEWREMLTRNGVRFLTCEFEDGFIALPELLEDLGALGIQSIMVEGGALLAASFLNEDLVDEIIVHVGGEPESPSEDRQGVFASFTPQSPPAGFSIEQELVFGCDRSLRMRKKN